VEGPWVGGPDEDSADRQCSITAPFAADGTISIVLGEVLVVVLEKKSWRLPRKFGPVVSVKLGRRKAQSVLANRTSARELVLAITEKDDFLRGLRKAKSLAIEYGEYEISIALTPSGKAIDRLTACVAGNFAPAAVDDPLPLAPRMSGRATSRTTATPRTAPCRRAPRDCARGRRGG
jgi:hypothetical protein